MDDYTFDDYADFFNNAEIPAGAYSSPIYDYSPTYDYSPVESFGAFDPAAFDSYSDFFNTPIPQGQMTLDAEFAPTSSFPSLGEIGSDIWGRMTAGSPTDVLFRLGGLGLMLGQGVAGAREARRNRALAEEEREYVRRKRAEQEARQAQIDRPLSFAQSAPRVQTPYGGNPGMYGRAGGEHRFFTNEQGVDPRMLGVQVMAQGGLARMAQGAFAVGPGGGQDDRIAALVSPGEYVMDATTVADLGDGNPEEGARRLDEMRSKLARHKGRKKAVPPKAKRPAAYLSGKGK